MSVKHFKVEVQGDHLERLANARPVQAVAELVWNGLDADAGSVDVIVESTDFGTQSITVVDNGHGIPHEDAHDLFTKLGGSWKARGNRSKGEGRMLHGKEGKGRFKALALGRVADWTVIYEEGGELYRYTITLLKDDLVDVGVSDPVKVDTGKTGVEVKVTELHRDFRSLTDETAPQELTEIFAIYLFDYTKVTISFQGIRLDPSEAISSRKRLPLDPISDEGEIYDVSLEIIEWKSQTERALHLCSENGIPLQRLQPRIHAPGFQFSAYLKSPYVSLLHERGVLELAEMNSALQACYESAQDQIRNYFRDRQIERARSEIEQWKAEKVYPYLKEPGSAVEEAERKVFDIVALNVNRHLPDFAASDKKSKAFQLRMLRQAIESGPAELQLILNEVLELPERKQRELAKLLEEASLSNFISASKVVADRLKFIGGLDALLFDVDLKKHLKERSQLHRILADNTWVFGEEFNLTVDDQSLTEVLRKHKKLIGSDVVIDKPVKRVDGTRGIVDLMLSRAVPSNRADSLEHLVVELKAPKVKIGSDAIDQVKKYARAVAADERFRSLDTRWTFWVISADLTKDAQEEVKQMDRPRGLVWISSDGQIKVWVKTWSEVLAGCRARLRFMKEKLEHNIDKPKSLKYLQTTYQKYLEGVIETEEEEPGPEVEAGEPTERSAPAE